MKNFFHFSAALVILGLISCKSAPKFSDVSGKEWKLIEVQLSGKSIGFDRNTLNSEGFGDIFTLNFDAERISGTGAPNKYSAPYTVEKDLSLKVSPIAGTLMAPLRQPEKLKEHDFFTYLQDAEKWNLVGGNLQLASKAEDGSDVTLIFSLDTVKK
ncbi:MAG: META domain-containing protein [Spirochaetaceae bacterium]|jgi:heat shock protein HslJ|nr:META domain-containing protein [Spirochaetaceae bacterium]